MYLYRGISLTSKRTPLGPYCRPMPRVLGGSQGGGRFLMSEVPLYSRRGSPRAEAVLLGPPRDLRRGRELLLPESGGGREGEREGQREREREALLTVRAARVRLGRPALFHYNTRTKKSRLFLYRGTSLIRSRIPRTLQ